MCLFIAENLRSSNLVLSWLPSSTKIISMSNLLSSLHKIFNRSTVSSITSSSLKHGTTMEIIFLLVVGGGGIH